MGEIVEDTKEIPPADAPKVAVAVGKGDSSVQALKWALEKVIPAGGILHLLHVQPPLHFIQTPLGALPLDQANNESVAQAKRQRFCTTEKLLQKYKKMGVKNKVVIEVHYVENDSVHEAVVERIVTLGISKLVLGSSSQSRITKLIKGPGTEVLIAKDAPDFCAVMIVHKGKLRSVKDSSKSFSSDSSNSSVFSSCEQDTSLSSLNEEVLPGLQSSIVNTNISFQGSKFPRLPRGQVASDSGFTFDPIDNKEICCGDFKDDSMLVHTRHSSLSQFQLSSKQCSLRVTNQHSLPGCGVPRNGSVSHTRAASTPVILDQSNDGLFQLPGVITKKNLVSSLGSNEPLDMQLALTNAHGKEISTPVSKISFAQDNCKFLNASSANLGDWETSSKADASRNSVASVDGHRQSSIESMEHNLHLEDTTTTTASHEAKGLDLKRKEGSQIFENALKELKAVKLQLEVELRRRQELCAALEEARRDAKVASRAKEIALQAVADETKKREEAATALSNLKIEATAFEREANLAHQQAEAEKSRCKKAMADFEEIKKDLAREVQLRKTAEECVQREAIAKQEAIAALRQAQREYSEYRFEELQEATNNFSEDQKLGEGGYGGVYKGRLHHTDVAVKVLKRRGSTGHEQFRREVELLSRIHHPHMVTLFGACREKACIVYEYMANGSLEDCLLCKDGKPPLPWHVRFRICSEVATALMFLHNFSPEPIIHRDLKPGNILLDHNFVSKISDVGIARLIPNNLTYSATVYRDTIPQGTFAYMDPEYLRTGSFGPHSDVYALGILILQVLTGQQAFGLVDKVESAICDSSLKEVLDSSAGDWPLSEALKLAKLSIKCAEPRRRDRPDLQRDVFVVLKNICKVAEAAATTEANQKSLSSCNDAIIPSFFICPISQEVMDDPHIAADGFTYEYRPIKNWLNGHSTSPMTNLRLDHMNLIQDCSLRSAILEWKARWHAL